jgi:type III secretory pathway component EscR
VQPSKPRECRIKIKKQTMETSNTCSNCKTQITCPICKTNYEEQPKKCTKCRYPFEGTDKEIMTFRLKRIADEEYIDNTKNRLLIAKVIIFIIGGLQIVFAMFIPFFVLLSIIAGVTFIICGLSMDKKPIYSISIPLVFLLVIYTAGWFAQPRIYILGLILQILAVSGLVYALIGVIKTEKIRKQSKYLDEYYNK